MKILLDPGHGGSDPGAMANGLKEKDINLKICLKLAGLLKTRELEVVLVRDKDIYLDLNQRIHPCDISVSIHANSGGGKGLETWVAQYNKPVESRKLGKLVHESILEFVPFEDRGLKSKQNSAGNQDYLYMIRRPTGIPILVECGFIDNTSDAKILKDQVNLDLTALGITKGIMNYLGRAESAFFKDVTKNYWAVNSIERLAKLGIIKGDGDGNFRPNDALTRAEAVVLLDRVLKHLETEEAKFAMEDLYNPWYPL